MVNQIANSNDSALQSAESIATGDGNLFTGTGKKSLSTKNKNVKLKVVPAVAFVIIMLIVVCGVISFLTSSFQGFSYAAQAKAYNKLSAIGEKRTEDEVARILRSTDPADSLSPYMQELFAAQGFEYVENDNGDGTVARALIYKDASDQTNLIASTNLKSNLMQVLSSSGTIVDNFRDIAVAPSGQDEVAAALYAIYSQVAIGLWFDDGAGLTYTRLGLNPAKFNEVPDNPDDQTIIDAAKEGSVNEDLNPTTGTTKRYTWNTHHYTYCSGGISATGVCLGPVAKTCSDWDSESPLDGAKRVVLYPESRTVCEGDATPEDFSSDDTKITSEDSKDKAKSALDKRAIISAFSTDPTSPQTGLAFNASGKLSAASGDPTHVASIKSGSSVISALSGLIRNRSVNLAHNYLNAIDKAEAGSGGMEMNYYANLLNTPAKSYDVDGNEYSNIAATASAAYNSWFSEDVKVDPSNKIVQKYNIANTLGDNGVTSVAIGNRNKGNYNNIENTSSNAKIAENMDNSKTGGDGIPYYYCEYSSASSAKCPTGQNGEPNETLNPDDYRLSSDLADYVYSLTSLDLSVKPAGEDAGVALSQGTMLLNDSMLKQTSGAYGDTDAVLALHHLNQEYVAKVANYDRHTKSPFDASSPHTFLGSIVAKTLPIATATKNNAFFSAITGITQVAASSISSLLPSVAASSLEDFSYINGELTTDCIAGQTSEMVCDVYGNPVVSMDLRYMDSEPTSISAIEQKMESWGYVKAGSCASEKGCEIVKDYDTNHPKDEYSFTKWLLCTQNDTMINNNLSNEQNVQTAARTGIFKRIINFIKGIFTRKGEDNIRIQASCGGNYAKESTANERYAVFAQFKIDQRLKSIMNDTETDSTTAYLLDYYNEHPLDTSYEAIIARYAGTSVAAVREAFAEMEYAVYVARANANHHSAPQSTISIDQTNRDVMKFAAIIGKIADFEELRNRSVLCG